MKRIQKTQAAKSYKEYLRIEEDLLKPKMIDRINCLLKHTFYKIERMEDKLQQTIECLDNKIDHFIENKLEDIENELKNLESSS
jgi:hypothetical protein